jgi:predicted outer membrane protein
MNRHIAGLLIAGLAATPVVSAAQPAVPPDAVEPPVFSRTVTPADADFVNAMLSEGRAQIVLAQLAEQRAQSAGTRDLAARTEAEWTSIIERLGAIADAQGLATPADTTVPGQALLDRLSGTPSAAFDTAYRAIVAGANARTLSRMQAERRSGNPALVALVNDHLRWFSAR